MILSSLIIAFLISYIGIFTNYKFFKKEITEKLTLLPQNYSNRFNADFKAVETSVNILKQYSLEEFDVKEFNENCDDYVKKYKIKMDSIIKRVAKNTNDIQALYITLNPELTGDAHEVWYADKVGDGNLIKLNPDPDPEDPYIDYFYPDNEEMQWYYEPIKKGQGVWSDPSKETDLNITSISYTEPIFKEDVLVGVVGIDINIEAMKSIIQNIEVCDTGYAFLLNDKYNFLIHPTLKLTDNLKSIENGDFKFIIEDMEKNNTGIKNYKFDGKTNILGYSHLYNKWILAFVVPVNEAYSSLNTQIFFTIITTLLCTIIIIPITLYLGKTISKPIVMITELIKNTSNFNFVDNNHLGTLAKKSDEIGTMARELSNMRKILKETGIGKAARLQRQSLQKEFPLLNKLNIETLYVPAKTVSGDFYYIEKINDDVVIGVIWDISGKGVTAALNTYAFNILFHEVIEHNHNPVEILKELNIKVANFFGETYIAACCFSFDFKNKIAKIAGAGINQFMYSTNKDYYQEREVKGPFLGMFMESIFDQQTICFKPGDKFYFLTDGLEFMFSDKELREEIVTIPHTNQLISFFNNNLKDIQAKNSCVVDDCTLIAIEIK